MSKHWIFSCKDVSYRISLSMDEKLSIWTRLCLRLHLIVCYMCSRYKKQLEFIRLALSRLGSDNLSDQEITPLPEDAKKKITEHLKSLS